MENVEYKTARIVIPGGKNQGTKDIHLVPGLRIVAAATTNRAPGQLVSIGLEETGNRVSVPMDVDFWRRSTGGSYLDGFKPLETRGGAMLTITATGSRNVDAATETDLEIEVVFAIVKEGSAC